MPNKKIPSSKNKFISKIEVIQSCLFLIGAVCIVAEINLYRITFVPAIIPTSIWIVIGIIASIISNNRDEKRSFLSQACFWSYNLFSWGSIAVYIFMFLNFHFREPDTTLFWETYSKNQIGHLAKGRYGCAEPYIEIEYKGERKQIIFSCDSSVERYNTIKLTIKNGLLGYNVIENKTLAKEYLKL